MNRQEYLASLPRKIIAAGCLFFDTKGKILIVKPVYRDTWNLPGGVVEANESPRNACRREVREEIGIEIKLGRLLCIDYTSKNSLSDRISTIYLFWWHSCSRKNFGDSDCCR